jgi:hypothetical protein
MKYLIFIVIVIFMVSCTEQMDDYRGENVVLGTWDSYYEGTDSLVLTRVFTPDYYSFFSFAEGKPQDSLNLQSYRIVDNYIMLEKYTQSFKLKGDSLWITNSAGDQTTTYIKRGLNRYAVYAK